MARTRADLESTLAFAHEHGLPVTARGGGVGYVGGCVPVRGGIALSLAEMKTIKEIHLNDAVAIVEPGGVAMREGRRRSYRR